MSRHRWEEETEYEYGTKPHVCVKCRIRKVWRGGDYQAWEYWWSEAFKAMNGTIGFTTHNTFDRPECKPIKKSE